MLALTAFLATQATNVTSRQEGLSGVLNRTTAVGNLTFDCMDRESKKETVAHVLGGTPENIVSDALASCSYLKKQYAEAATDPAGGISATAAETVADAWFERLKEAYIKQVDTWMATPEIADANLNLVILSWKKCVSEKAADWSRLTDAANSVAQAAVTACSSFRPDLLRVIRYEYRSKGAPGANIDGLLDKLSGDVKDFATEIVISERAKRLPKSKPDQRREH